MKPRFYKILQDTIEVGILNGLAQAKKHNDNPEDFVLTERILNSIMGELHENFIFDADDNP